MRVRSRFCAKHTLMTVNGHGAHLMYRQEHVHGMRVTHYGNILVGTVHATHSGIAICLCGGWVSLRFPPRKKLAFRIMEGVVAVEYAKRIHSTLKKLRKTCSVFSLVLRNGNTKD